ncbi:MAG: LysR substrate-binding domain-containing protein, partial [Myxococcota bacterium]
LRPPPPNAANQLESGELDLLLGATTHMSGGDVVMRKLSETRFVSYMRGGHPLLKGEPSVEAWLATPHVQVMTGDRERNILGTLLEQQGLERQRGVEVYNFMMALATVAATRSIFTAPDVMKAYAAEVFGLETITPPIELPTVVVGMFWHRRWHQDEAHRWFRDGVAAALTVLSPR